MVLSPFPNMAVSINRLESFKHVFFPCLLKLNQRLKSRLDEIHKILYEIIDSELHVSLW